MKLAKVSKSKVLKGISERKWEKNIFEFKQSGRQTSSKKLMSHS